MDIIKINNSKLLEDWLKGNGPQDFKRNFPQTSEYVVYVDTVINTLCIPVLHSVNKEVLIDEIIFWAFHTCMAVKHSKSEREFFKEVRSNMELAFGDYAVTGVLMVMVGTWAGCLFLGSNLNLNMLKDCSIEAAFTKNFQGIIEDNWARVHIKFEQYR